LSETLVLRLMLTLVTVLEAATALEAMLLLLLVAGLEDAPL